MKTKSSQRAGADRKRSQGNGSPPHRSAPPGWEKPRLTVFGDLRQLTMGPSLGAGESGDPLNLRA